MAKRQAPWERNERHYCETCNVWLASDRHSISLHENGKAHRDKVAATLLQRRQTQQAHNQEQALLQQSLAAMNANVANGHDASYYGHASLGLPAQAPPVAAGTGPPHQAYAAAAYAVPQLPPPPLSAQESGKNNWQARKEQRKEARHVKTEANDDDDDNNNKSAAADALATSKPIVTLGQGTYKIDDVTYLEGITYGDLLDEELPVQVWTGPQLATPAEQRLPDRQHWWRPGLIATMRWHHNAHVALDHADRLVVNVSYLAAPDDKDETLLKSVTLPHVRLVLGADDERLPQTLEEARIMAMGGEEMKVVPKQQPLSINEATGLSMWSTVALKRTTAQQEAAQARARERAQRADAARKAAAVQKEAEARRLEETQHANADDSALGAYHVFDNKSGGYKGVSIQDDDHDPNSSVHDAGKKLSNTKVDFKKVKKKNAGNRRTTSADDD